jgi:hypothetical protein
MISPPLLSTASRQDDTASRQILPSFATFRLLGSFPLAMNVCGNAAMRLRGTRSSELLKTCAFAQC